MAEDAGGDEETAGVWPGYDLVLTPPPRDDNAATLTLRRSHNTSLTYTPHIEAQHKGHRNQISKTLTVNGNLLKLLLPKVNINMAIKGKYLSVIPSYPAGVVKYESVREGEGVVEQYVEGEVLPDQLVDTASPFEE